jgi:heme oxygenase
LLLSANLSGISIMAKTHNLLSQSVKDLHRTLDHHPLLSPLISDHISKQAYLRAMALLQRCFMLTEPALALYESSTGVHQMDGYIPRAFLIDSEVNNYSPRHPIESEGIRPLGISTVGEYLGIRYVLEGSAQGGRFIKANLLKVFPEFNSPFWEQQEKTARNWPMFLNSLTQLDDDKNNQQRAIDAARSTFELFISEFEEDYK